MSSQTLISNSTCSSAAESDSVPKLIRHLTELALSSASGNRRTNLTLWCNNESDSDGDVVRKRLRSTAYNALFRYLRQLSQKRQSDKKSVISESHVKLTVKDEALVEVFRLRCERQFDSAQRLEDLIDSLGKDNTMLTDTSLSVLRLIIALRGTAPTSLTPPIGHGSQKLATVVRSSEATYARRVCLPSGALCYGDTQYDVMSTQQHYLHYPPKIFTTGAGSVNSSSTGSEYAPVNNELFSLVPGENSASQSSYISRTALSLYGALVRSKITPSLASSTLSLNICLDLPDISVTSESTQLPTAALHEISDDEGFVDTTRSSSRRVSPAVSPLYDSLFSSCDVDSVDSGISMWRLALTCPPIKNFYTWEQQGCGANGCHNERPYLTEAGARAFDAARTVHQSWLHIIDPSLVCNDEKRITEAELIRDVHYLLVGVPSHCFTLDTIHKEFTMRPGLYTSGFSPAALCHACIPVLRSGTSLLRLIEFVQHGTQRGLGAHHTDLVFNAFRVGVRSYLRRYVACVLSLPHGETLLQISYRLRKLMLQISFLSQLCMCDDIPSSTSPPRSHHSFPKGTQLLTYLYRECLATAFGPHNLVMMSLFRTACEPYLLLVHDWVFHGEIKDVSCQFMVQADNEYLQYRDQRFWINGYHLDVPFTKDDGGKMSDIPEFLSEISSDIYICGKSLNLLKLCNANHFLFNDDARVGIPRLRLAFSVCDVSHLEHDCQLYRSRLHAITVQSNRTREAVRQAAEKAKNELIAIARTTATAQLQRLRMMRLGEKVKEDARKREAFAAFKQQMEDFSKRKAEVLALEKKSDQEFTELASKQTLPGQMIDEELEKQTREQLIEYYSKLSIEAVFREQRAIWKVHRHQLAAMRQRFLLAESVRLKAEIEDRMKTNDYDASVESEEDESVVTIEEPIHDLVEPTAEATTNSLPIKFGSSTSHLLAETTEILGNGERLFKVQNTQAHPAESVLAAEIISCSGVSSDANFCSSDSPIQRESELYTLTGSDKPGPSADQIVTDHQQQYTEDAATASNSNGNVAAVAAFAENENMLKNDLMDQEDEDLPHWARSKHIPFRQYRTSYDNTKNKPLNESNSSGLPRWARSDAQPTVHIDELKGSAAPSVMCDSLVSNFSHWSEPDESKPVRSPAPEIRLPRWLSRSLQARASYAQDHILLGDIEYSSVYDELDIETWDSEPRSYRSATSEKERPHHVSVPGRSANMETEPIAEKSYQGAVPGRSANAETETVIEKPHLASVHGKSAGLETKQIIERPHHASVPGKFSGLETKQFVEKPHHASVPGRSVTMETESVIEQRPHLAVVPGRSSGVETESVVEKRHITSVQGRSATAETDEKVWRSHTKMSTKGRSATTESWQMDGQNDASGVGEDYDEFRCFQIRPHRRQKVAGQFSERQTEPDAKASRSSVKINENVGASTESEPVDMDAVKVVRFHTRNIQGHSSDSSIQRLLYRQQPSDANTDNISVNKELSGPESSATDSEQQERYSSAWNNEFDFQPYTDIRSHRFELLPNVDRSAWQNDFNSAQLPPLAVSDLEASSTSDKGQEFISLPVLLRRTVMAPLCAQISIVNRSLLDYFVVDVDIESHFQTLHSFVLLQDGEFAQSLCEQLFEKVTIMSASERLNPSSLHQILHIAISQSLAGDTAKTKNISLLLNHTLMTGIGADADILNSLELTYQVEWPVNIVIAKSHLRQYGALFRFLLLIKRANWTLKDIFHRLKRDGSPQLQALQLYRHEMQHFVKVFQEFVSNQLVHVSWNEFLAELHNGNNLSGEGVGDGAKGGDRMEGTSSVRSLDDLIECHTRYLTKTMKRCLLNQRASPVMKIVRDLFERITTYSRILSSHTWISAPSQRNRGTAVHPAFNLLRETYDTFHQHSTLLFKVLRSLATCGYESHFEELLLRLNFNSFYAQN